MFRSSSTRWAHISTSPVDKQNIVKSIKRKDAQGGIMRKFLGLMSAVLAVFIVACSSGGSGGGVKDITEGRETFSPTATAEVAAEVSKEQEYAPPHARPGPAVDTLEFYSFGVDQALTELSADKMDIYTTGLKIAAAKQLKENKDIKSFQAPASSISLLLNPAPERKGKLNPFSIKEVRQAVNYLVNRQFITEDIYGGLAVPMQAQVSRLDYDYLTIAPVLASSSVSYDADLAKRKIAEAMESAGATLVGEKWHYEGRPVRIKFIIRVEDERRDVGDTIRQALENVGFQVDAVYKNFAAAILSVYTSDPQNFEWHLYTEGWGKGSPEKYDFATINQMSAPWMGNLPGWLIVGYWQYGNEQLDALGKKLFTGDFSDRSERDEIYREMTQISLDESVRIWVATVFNTFPAKNGVIGVTQDITSGPKSLLTMREAHIPHEATLRVGNLWVWTERSVWNPVGGFGDVYSLDIWKNITDPALVSHPFRGVPVPYRATYEVQTAGPGGMMNVPESAMVWDHVQDRWVKVDAGAQARSKVVFDYSKYFQASWHHGIPIDMQDVAFQLASLFERTYDAEKSRVEFVGAVTQRPLLDQFRGFEVLDDNRIAVYVDFWHFEENYIASYASLTSLPVPWELQAAMDNLVFEKRQAAYGQAAAARYNVPWLSLIMKRDASLVARVLREFEREGLVPEQALSFGGALSVNRDGALARYAAALRWMDDHEHLVISQGPFTLAAFDAPAQYARLEAFRETNYPFKPGDWYLGSPARLEISKVASPTSLSAGTTGEVKVKVEGPQSSSVAYLLVDTSSGKVLAKGSAKAQGNSTHVVPIEADLTRALQGKRLEVWIIVSSDEVILVKTEKVSIKIN